MLLPGAPDAFKRSGQGIALESISDHQNVSLADGFPRLYYHMKGDEGSPLLGEDYLIYNF